MPLHVVSDGIPVAAQLIGRKIDAALELLQRVDYLANGEFWRFHGVSFLASELRTFLGSSPKLANRSSFMRDLRFIPTLIVQCGVISS